MERRKFIFYTIFSSLLLSCGPCFSKDKNMIKKVKINGKYWILSSEDI